MTILNLLGIHGDIVDHTEFVSSGQLSRGGGDSHVKVTRDVRRKIGIKINLAVAQAFFYP